MSVPEMCIFDGLAPRSANRRTDASMKAASPQAGSSTESPTDRTAQSAMKWHTGSGVKNAPLDLRRSAVSIGSVSQLWFT